MMKITQATPELQPDGTYTTKIETIDVPDDFFPGNPPDLSARHLTPLELQNRFTQAEQVSITLRAYQDLALNDPSLMIAMNQMNAATYIDLDLPEVAAYLDLAVSKGLISEDRKAEILA